jgi:hypothetical protein
MFKLVKINDMADASSQNASSQPVQGKPKMHPVKKFFRRVLLFFILLFILAGAGIYIYFNYTFSEGYRAGTLIKFSRRGFVKTYEGELNLGGVNPIPGNTIANNMWRFSVKEDSVAQRLMGMEGKVLRLHYKEKVRSFFWQGETNYFVDDIQEVK